MSRPPSLSGGETSSHWRPSGSMKPSPVAGLKRRRRFPRPCPRSWRGHGSGKWWQATDPADEFDRHGGRTGARVAFGRFEPVGVAGPVLEAVCCGLAFGVEYRVQRDAGGRYICHICFRERPERRWQAQFAPNTSPSRSKPRIRIRLSPVTAVASDAPVAPAPASALVSYPPTHSWPAL